MASALARAYNGGLGAEPPVESMGRAPGQEDRGPLKLKHFWFLDVQWNPRNLPTFLQFRNIKKSDICPIFAKKNHGWTRNWGV